MIVAGIASIALLGNYTYFGHTPATLVDVNDWVAVLLCGLLGGLFSRLVLAAADGLPGRVASGCATTRCDSPRRAVYCWR